MAVKYDFFLTPQPKEKQQKVRYHARTVVDRTFSNKDIANEISKRCTINKAEAMAVMDEMADIFLQKLSEGHAIKLDGIGTFHISAKSPSVRSKKEIRAESIQCGGVVYRAEKKLLRKLSTTKFQKVACSKTSLDVSDIELDGILMTHFKDHPYITTKELQDLSGLSNHTALRRLKERVEAGKMTHPGHRYSGFYFPVPGNYGISTDKDTASAL
jgi:predicted histone-like DNA-binding protein